MGVQPTALSLNAVAKGIGWQRFGNNLNFWCWKKGPSSEYALSFTFSVKEPDTIYFSYLYPYSYTDMRNHLTKLGPSIHCTILCNTLGGVEFPVIFWDADVQKCVNAKRYFSSHKSLLCLKKPLIVITSRHHPGESNASYAMEGFMSTLFNSGNEDSERLLKNFSFLLIPMMNPDGVICGYYRPTLSGYDQNRVWIRPNRRSNPVEFILVSLLDQLVRSRPLIFFLDYHGHTAQCNAFSYGVFDENCTLNEYESFFPQIMSRYNSVFDEAGSCTFNLDSFSSTMRVALHNRYQIPFAYTLEMSFGGIDIGSNNFTQMTPNTYRSVGVSTVPAIASMLLDQVPISQYISNYFRPISRTTLCDPIFI